MSRALSDGESPMDAGSSGASGTALKTRGRPFPKGKSGNPSGLSKERYNKRQAVAQALDKVMVLEDGTDLLVEALKIGVIEREPTLVRLACEYRWGRAPLVLQGDEDNPLRVSVEGARSVLLSRLAPKP